MSAAARIGPSPLHRLAERGLQRRPVACIRGGGRPTVGTQLHVAIRRLCRENERNPLANLEQNLRRCSMRQTQRRGAIAKSNRTVRPWESPSSLTRLPEPDCRPVQMHGVSDDLVCSNYLPSSLRPQASGLRRRWSQTARQPAATRSKWVRLPPASLTWKLKKATGDIAGPAAHGPRAVLAVGSMRAVIGV